MSDLFESYKKGLDRLLEMMSKDHQDYNEALILRTRLYENIENTNLFGDDPIRKAERNQIIHNLNKLASHVIGKPFHLLYEVKEKPHPHQSSSNKPPIDEPGSVYQSEQGTSSKSDYRNLIGKIEHTTDMSISKYISDTLMDKFVKDISVVIEWLRSPGSNTREFTMGKVAVLTYLRNARTKFSLASEEYRRKGSTERFFNNVEAGRVNLEKALQAW